MVAKAEVEELLSELQSLASFVSTDLVEISSGKSMGGIYGIPDMDSTGICKTFTVVLNEIDAAFSTINVPGVTGIKVKTAGPVVFIQVVDSNHYIGLAIGNPEEANVAADKLNGVVEQMKTIL